MEEFLETINWLKERAEFQPEFGIILGTGLGGMVQKLEIIHSFNYADIPNFPLATAETHAGKLHFAIWAGKKLVVAQGRFHHYEGYNMKQVTYPVRIMKMLGIHTLLISNISGGLNPDYQLSDLVAIEDHINLHVENPLTGPNLKELGPRWPDMHEPYNQELLEKAVEFSKSAGIKIHSGVYASVPGPNLETRAEYKYLARIGADCVGMSTVPEVIVAAHMELRTFAVSAISDICYGKIQKANIEQLLQAASESEPKMIQLFQHLIETA
jgi:purine-nucleoside phosphorylase